MSAERWVVAVEPPEVFLLLEDCAEAVEETEIVSTVASIATEAVKMVLVFIAFCFKVVKLWNNILQTSCQKQKVTVYMLCTSTLSVT